VFRYPKGPKPTSKPLAEGIGAEGKNTLPETNVALENGWLVQMKSRDFAYFQGRNVSFRE